MDGPRETSRSQSPSAGCRATFQAVTAPSAGPPPPMRGSIPDQLWIELWNAQVMRRPVQPPRVVRQPEQPHATILPAESLHPVEDRLPIVQHAACRIQGKGPIRHNTRIVPSLPFIVLHHEHVVGEHTTERQRLIRRRLFRAGGPRDSNLGQSRSRYSGDNDRLSYASRSRVSRPLSEPIRRRGGYC